MSDQKIMEFRQRAEHGLDFPDLASIERQGRALHRRRLAATAGGFALAVVAGLGIASAAMDDGDAALDPATTPYPAPSTSWDDSVRTSFDGGEEMLSPGPSRIIYGGTSVSIDVPGKDWEWWGAGTGLRRADDSPDEYGAAVFFLPDASARLQPCGDDRTQALGTDPDQLVANVAPLLDLAHSTVLQGPRVVSAFGGEAVHLRLQSNGACPEGDGPLQLRGVVNEADADPAWTGKHELDVWYVVIPGAEPSSMLVASWDLDGTSEHREQRAALIDSLRIEAS